MGRVQSYNLYIRLRSRDKLLVIILCVGSTDLVKEAIACKVA